MKSARIIGTDLAYPATGRVLQIPAERTYDNIERYGNTAAASVPMCLREALRDGWIEDGVLVILLAFGTDFSWGATLLRW